MKIVYGLTEDRTKGAEWFDTWEEVQAVHEAKSSRWNWYIVVYAMSEQICQINYSPTGYFVTGFFSDTENGIVDKMAKHGITYEMLFGKVIVR